MTHNSKRAIFVSVLILISAAAILMIMPKGKSSKEVVREIFPMVGNIQSVISSTAIVQPQSRLEIKPPINGRINEILVKEGETVKSGQTLAWMSSTERAALLDAARGRGEEAMKYWADVYKATPLISPIDGQVIVSTDKPGQTVTTSDIVVVISDRLIVQAQIDETDIGKVRLGQSVGISLDAYPDIKLNGVVDHIYYESETVNNVNIYQVDIVPETVPAVFRSGMTATVNILESEKNNVLTIPQEVVKHGKDGDYVIIGQAQGKKEERKIELGASDEKNVEVLSGLSENDRILAVSQKFTMPDSSSKTGKNPFMPSMRKGGK
ncbi:MAG: efflux RND transporter periplasmic adaptor subunit [Candidatus Omnitrophica bacterium]|nr:efflux RND transporter periplasmic adaptor subunit [Candidatus Omnitrophota bacterium]